jgi:hypothetical protein
MFVSVIIKLVIIIIIIIIIIISRWLKYGDIKGITECVTVAGQDEAN